MEKKNSRPRPKMPVAQRAKQFMPFAAVTGLEKALAEKEREVLEKGRMDGDRGFKKLDF